MRLLFSAAAVLAAALSLPSPALSQSEAVALYRQARDDRPPPAGRAEVLASAAPAAEQPKASNAKAPKTKAPKARKAEAAAEAELPRVRVSVTGGSKVSVNVKVGDQAEPPAPPAPPLDPLARPQAAPTRADPSPCPGGVCPPNRAPQAGVYTPVQYDQLSDVLDRLQRISERLDALEGRAATAAYQMGLSAPVSAPAACQPAYGQAPAGWVLTAPAACQAQPQYGYGYYQAAPRAGGLRGLLGCGG